MFFPCTDIVTQNFTKLFLFKYKVDLLKYVETLFEAFPCYLVGFLLLLLFCGELT